MIKVFKRLRAYVSFRRAVNMADDRFFETQQRYYVVGDKSGKLIVTDRKNFRILKQKGYVDHRLSVADMERFCFYHTPYANGSGRLDDFAFNVKRQRCYNFMMQH